MILKQFKQHIISFPIGTKFNFGISQPFSWRGSYDAVAFEVLEKEMLREDILAKIELAYTQTFEGYKGGEFRYNDYTHIYFEPDYGIYTDGMYTAQLIAKIENEEVYRSQEERLVKKAFR